MPRPPFFLLAFFAVVPLQSALAVDIPSVSATVSGYTAIGVGAIPEDQWQHIAITRKDGPLYAEASGSGGRFFSDCPTACVNDRFTSAAVTGFASAAPGVLRVFGADAAVAQNGSLGPNLPPVQNSSTVYTNIQSVASFTDYLTVEVVGKAVGTPVKVPFNYLVEVVSDTVLGYPVYSAHPISVYARFDIPGLGPQIFSSEAGLNFFQSTSLGNGLYVSRIRSSEFSFDAHVGDVLPISATFGISGQANITDFNRQLTFGAAADGRNTAGIWLGTLPSGLGITSASGHDYTIDPTAPVPEPTSAALMLVGLLTIGLAQRARAADRSRRTHRQPAPTL